LTIGDCRLSIVDWGVSCLLSCLVVCTSCNRSRDSAAKPIVAYCSVDEALARPILDAYSQRTGMRISAVYDSEAGKTTGLIQRIMREAQSGRPHADIFWSGEVFNTVLLSRMGLLDAYAPANAAEIPARFRGGEARWTGYAVRARVIAFDPQRTARSEVPASWADLAKPEIAGRLALANPLFGTTHGHVAALFARWGDERGRKFLEQLRSGGAQVVDGNSAAVRAVIAGRADFAATDSDDVWVAKRGGASLDLAYPDLGDGGTLLVPCSVAVLRGAANGAAARSLADYLTSAEVERLLAQSAARHVPVRDSLRRELGMGWPAESAVDYDAVTDALPLAAAAAREILIR
jgi:iron(III) transport system substrate-binding protein